MRATVGAASYGWDSFAHGGYGTASAHDSSLSGAYKDALRFDKLYGPPIVISSGLLLFSYFYIRSQLQENDN
jgi:hypothetical protein